MLLLNIFDLIGIVSSYPRFWIIVLILSVPNLLISSSSNDMKNCEYPGSPWRPARPLNWLSIRLDSCLSVPITHSPPSSLTPSPSLISVPRPAMFVAIVIAPFWPAFAMISASLAWFLAFNTSCGRCSFWSSLLRCSFDSTEIVPTRIGCPLACTSLIKFTIALYLPFSVANIKSAISSLIHGLFVGISITYIL